MTDDLRVGVVGRCEARGLGYQSLDVARHLDAAVLLVAPTPQRHPTHPDWYDGLPVTPVEWSTNDGRHHLHEPTVRAWLADVDVVYAAETLYDWRLARWAADAGVAVVVHVNPELLAPAVRSTPGVCWWAPTPWLLHTLPEGTRVVPQPVAADQATAVDAAPVGGPVRFLHVVGHAAHLDRNGTRVLAQALSKLRCYCDVTVTAQDGAVRDVRARDRRVTVRCLPGYDNRWDAYRGDVLVMPRRYGGLSLPAQEAMAAGMAVVMPDVVPNGEWPGPRFAHRGSLERPMLGGRIPVFEPDGLALAQLMEHLAGHPDQVEAHKADARVWAAANSWDVLGALWRAELAKAAGQ